MTTTEPKTQQFTLGQVLTITVDRLLCEDIGQFYEILNFITGDNLFTHQLPRAARFAKKFIPIQVSEAQVADLDRRVKEANDIGGNVMGAIGAWLSLLDLPMLVEVECHADAWLLLDPMAELEGMIGKNKAMLVDPSMSSDEIAGKIKRSIQP